MLLSSMLEAADAAVPVTTIAALTNKMLTFYQIDQAFLIFLHTLKNMGRSGYKVN